MLPWSIGVLAATQNTMTKSGGVDNIMELGEMEDKEEVKENRKGATASGTKGFGERLAGEEGVNGDGKKEEEDGEGGCEGKEVQLMEKEKEKKDDEDDEEDEGFVLFARKPKKNEIKKTEKGARESGTQTGHEHQKESKNREDDSYKDSAIDEERKRDENGEREREGEGEAEIIKMSDVIDDSVPPLSFAKKKEERLAREGQQVVQFVKSIFENLQATGKTKSRHTARWPYTYIYIYTNPEKCISFLF